MSIRPGEGYLMRRMGMGTVTMHFYDQKKQSAPKKANANANASAFSNPNAASNMTMIAKIEEPTANANANAGLMAYIGDELVGVATPIIIANANAEVLYFITIQFDLPGELRFETEDGTSLQPLTVNHEPLTYQPNAHHGSLKAPIVLKPGDNRPYKIIENNHVIIIRNNEKYSIDDKKL